MRRSGLLNTGRDGWFFRILFLLLVLLVVLLSIVAFTHDYASFAMPGALHPEARKMLVWKQTSAFHRASSVPHSGRIENVDASLALSSRDGNAELLLSQAGLGTMLRSGRCSSGGRDPVIANFFVVRGRYAQFCRTRNGSYL